MELHSAGANSSFVSSHDAFEIEEAMGGINTIINRPMKGEALLTSNDSSHPFRKKTHHQNSYLELNSAAQISLSR
jgi:hypothetical protein